MTQTIHLVESDENTVHVYNGGDKGGIYRDIDELPAKASYRYTVSCAPYTWDDFIEEAKWSDQNAAQEFAEIMECFMAAEDDTIWVCTAERGHDDYRNFFPTQKEAQDDLTSQYC